MKTFSLLALAGLVSNLTTEAVQVTATLSVEDTPVLQLYSTPDCSDEPTFVKQDEVFCTSGFNREWCDQHVPTVYGVIIPSESKIRVRYEEELGGM